MAEVVLFHHAQGLTSGVLAFAAELRAAGHTTHVPDLYDGRTFADLDAGIAHMMELGEQVDARADAAVTGLGAGLVLLGMSMGVMPAQRLAQTRPGAAGALLLYSCVDPNYFAAGWPAGVPVQVHGMDADPVFVGDGDIDAARALVEQSPDDAELFLYAGDQHLFADRSLSSYVPEAAQQLTERVLAFLAEVDS